MRTLLFLSIPILFTSCFKSKQADLIVHNAQIYTCDEDFNVYDAMAIKDGKIIEVGAEREIMNRYVANEVIDAEWKAVFPGFHDAHCHFEGYAKTLIEVDLTGSKSYDEMIDRIVEFEKKNEMEWCTGRGWDHTLWPGKKFPTNERLNKIFPEKPVAFRRVDGHAAIVNQKALDIAGITPETVIPGGEIVVKDGKCTGLLLDNAFDSLAVHIPVLSEEEMLPIMQQAQEDLFEVGLTSINDAGIEHKDLDKFIKWYSNGDLKIKNYCMLFPDEENLAFAKDSGIYRTGNLHIRSFKIVADGSLGSRSACLLEEYADQHGHFGFLLRDPEAIKEIAELAVMLDYQVNTHCIGDSTNRTILKIYEEVIGSVSDHRWKIEHAQVLAPKDFDYFEMYNIIPSVQPTHCTSDMRWAEERLGSSRVKHAYAYQVLLDRAGKIALGTDFPVEGISPLETFYAAVSRQDKDGYPENGFQSENALDPMDALYGMTIWPAYSNFENHEKGSLEAGKAADFVILDRDIMRIRYEDILNTFVVATYLNGKKVYSAK
ncbi:MAG: amidohydrolase [Crocinitomicaceae bacterium]|nr:amidohydrolase [Crocinitomicaceae bacterium]